MLGTPRRLDISPKIKKLAIILLLGPSSLFWLVFSAFGIAYFHILAFQEFAYTAIYLASWSGVFFCICAIFAALKYPKVSKFVAVSSVLGSITLVVVLMAFGFVVEMPTTPILVIPAVLVMFGVLMLLREFQRGT